MAGDRYFITDQQSRYFLTLTVVYWIDLFTRKEYRDIITESINYCISEKGLDVYGMGNHVKPHSPGVWMPHTTSNVRFSKRLQEVHIKKDDKHHTGNTRKSC